MALDILLIANGITSLIVSIVSIYIGLRIVLKYFRYKERILIFAGFTWLLMYEGWWGPSLAFIILIFTNQLIPIELFFFISMGLIPLSIALWMIAFADFLYEDKLKQITIIFTIQIIIYEILIFYYIFTEPFLIVESVGFIDAKYKSFLLFFLIEIFVLLLITGPLFARESFKSDKPEIRLKGKFLLIGFLSFLTGSLLDAFLELELITLLIYRSLLVFSSISFYFSFFLPKTLKNYLLKKS